MSLIVSNFDALDAAEAYDVCIVGAGIAGAVLGVTLLRAGLRVLIVDAGPTQAADEYRGRAADGGPGPFDLPQRRRARAQQTGPTFCERLDPVDFRAHPYTRRSNPWPISYTDLEPHYCAAERMLRARQSLPAPDRHLPGAPGRPVDAGLAALLRRHGIDAKGAACATPGHGRERFHSSSELLPEFRASRRGVVASGITVTRLCTDENGRVTAAVCRATDGTSKLARAGTFILAAGPLETPRLLLASRSRRFPHGVGNDHDRVGRGFADQAVIRLRGSMDRVMDRLGPLPGVCTPLHTEQFHQMFRRYGLGAVHPYFERTRGIRWQDIGKRSWRDILANAASRRDTLSLTCRVETIPHDENRVTLSTTAFDAFGEPRAQLVFSPAAEDLDLIARTRAWLQCWIHRLGVSRCEQDGLEWNASMSGTCRMGADPRASVCDATLRVHATPNLYLCGTEAFPRSGAVPAVLTVSALAHRLSRHISARVRWCARAAAKPARSIEAAHAVPILLARRRPQ